MIQIRNLVKRFGAQTVLADLSLAVARGEVAALMGPSGCGKSTLLRCLIGLDDFDEGQIEVAGVLLAANRVQNGSRDQTSKLRRHVGMVFQQFQLFPHLSVLENVIEAPITVLGKVREVAIGEARDLLDRVGMASKQDTRPDKLSGGQQQRVAIARALAMQPDVLLFDEPTSALDPRMAGEVEAVMADLARSGQTMLIVTHSVGFTRRAAQTLHVVDQGRIVESGAPERVLTQPATEAARQLLHGS